MMDLNSRLMHLRLQGYQRILASRGFHSWQQLMNITEADIVGIDMKLGHRRKLQRAIARSKGRRDWEPLDYLTYSERTSVASKRIYRRHPPRDLNAPPRPLSGYILFAKFLSQNPLVSNLPFTQIARLLGQQWDRLSSQERGAWLSRAKEQKRNFHLQLSKYQQTENYQSHQALLSLFMANKHFHNNDQLSATQNSIKSLEDKGRGDISTNQRMHSTPCKHGLHVCVHSSSACQQYGKFSVDATLYSIHSTPGSPVQSRELFPVLENNWRSAFKKRQTVFLDVTDIGHEILTFRDHQNIDQLQAFHTHDQNPFRKVPFKTILLYIDTFLQRVNTFYHLVGAEYLFHQLNSITDIDDTFPNHSIYLLSFCISIGCQIHHGGITEMAVMWLGNGQRHLDDDGWGVEANVMRALALISIFHLEERPATAQCYLGMALQIGRSSHFRDTQSRLPVDAESVGERATIAHTIQTIYQCLLDSNATGW